MTMTMNVLQRLNARAARTLGRVTLTAGLLAMGGAAQALDFGTLRLYLSAGQAPYAEITLLDSAPIDPADVRARIATPDAYGVAGMRYSPALQNITITPQAGPNGQVVLRLDRLPSASDQPDIDLLLLVGDRMSLALGEYRVDLRGSAREFAASPAGTRLASSGTVPAAPPAPSGVVSAGIASGTATAVNTPPIERPVAAANPTIRSSPIDPPAGAAPAGTSSAATDGVYADVEIALQAWAAAWRERDVDGYLAAYTPTYAGREKNSTREAWMQQRRTRITARKQINVDIDKLQFSRRDGAVVVTFNQRYKGDELSERSRKRMVFVQVNDRWLIQEESELP